jgi:tRNA (cmo5U34)-methyltransferase
MLACGIHHAADVETQYFTPVFPGWGGQRLILTETASASKKRKISRLLSASGGLAGGVRFNMPQDTLYNDPRKKTDPFEFNQKVVDVFDDMITRSVPLYEELIKREAQLAADYYQSGSVVVDLGCSNGNFGLCLCREMGRRPFKMVAVDNSEPMIGEYKSRLRGHPNQTDIELTCADIRDICVKNASVVVINYTLQFITIKDRDRLMEKLYRGLLPGGILLLSEKIIHEDLGISDLQKKYHHRLKRENGYSQLAVSQKRDALENVLIPESIQTHLSRLARAGFLKTDIFLKWFNFTSIICQK